jgi:hypothetical protein
VDPGCPEGFIGVDIANSGDHRLIKQGGLDYKALVTANPAAEFGPCIRIEWFGTHPCEKRNACHVFTRHDGEPAEFALVVEVQPTAVIEFQDHPCRIIR